MRTGAQLSRLIVQPMKTVFVIFVCFGFLRWVMHSTNSINWLRWKHAWTAWASRRSLLHTCRPRGKARGLFINLDELVFREQKKKNARQEKLMKIVSLVMGNSDEVCSNIFFFSFTRCLRSNSVFWERKFCFIRTLSLVRLLAPNFFFFRAWINEVNAHAMAVNSQPAVALSVGPLKEP